MLGKNVSEKAIAHGVSDLTSCHVMQLCILSFGVMSIQLIITEFYSFLTVYVLKFLSTYLEATLNRPLAGV